jgi:cytochrome c-type biogenesis protein CcmF
MIAELGQLMLALALAASLLTGAIGLWHLARGRYAEAVLARALAGSGMLSFALHGAAFGALVLCFVGNDFSVRNVAENSNALLPLQYQIAASWGSHEGSLLLWALMLAGWTAAVGWRSQHLAPGFRARVLAILLLLQAAFLGFLVSASNPFGRLLPAPGGGRDLNPLLQDPLMTIHPPVLYMGYVGFAVSFAFAVAALLERRLDPTWARWSRPWANAAWSFLTVGILLGSWWAYMELGWGGWWFWDPVENASLMPWLAGTALIHSLAVTDKRDALKSWTVLLAIVAFGLSLLGTFLVRSGVLTSVHAFAADPRRGVLILAMLVLILGAAFLLYALRTRDIGLGGRFAPVSRESYLLANNVLMAAALGSVMLGTLYPLFAEVLAGRKMSVGPPFFEAVFAPLLLPALWLMAMATGLRWKSASFRDSWRPLAIPLLAATAVTIAFVAMHGKTGFWTIAGLLSAVLLGAATCLHALRQLARLKQQGASRALFDRIGLLGPSYWGMIAAHAGVAVFVAGVTLVKTTEVERDVAMQAGQTETMGQYRITFVGVESVAGPNYNAARGVFELTSGAGKVIYRLTPEKRRYTAGGQVMTKAAIDFGLLGDIYLSLGEPIAAADGGDGGWSVRMYLKPFVGWIWIGCAMMALGGAITLFDRRYRRARAAVPA